METIELLLFSTHERPTPILFLKENITDVFPGTFHNRSLTVIEYKDPVSSQTENYWVINNLTEVRKMLGWK